MKKIIYMLVAMVATITVATSCSKDEYSDYLDDMMVGQVKLVSTNFENVDKLSESTRTKFIADFAAAGRRIQSSNQVYRTKADVEQAWSSLVQEFKQHYTEEEGQEMYNAQIVAVHRVVYKTTMTAGEVLDLKFGFMPQKQ